MNVCVPPACPNVNVPVFWKFTASTMIPPIPVLLKFTTVLGTLSVVAVRAPWKLAVFTLARDTVVALTDPLNPAVPPMLLNPSVPTPLTLVPLTSAPAIPSPVLKLKSNPPPVTVPNVISPSVVVACVFSVVAEPKVIPVSTSPNVIVVLPVVIVPNSVTPSATPVCAVATNPPVNVLAPPA